MAGATTGGDGDPRHITISDIGCDNLPDHARRHFVSIVVGTKTYKTVDAKPLKSSAWPDRFQCDVTQIPSITLTVFERRFFFCKKAIGSARIDLESTLDGDVNHDIPLEFTQLGKSKRKPNLIPRIRCKITEKTREQAVNEAVEDAESSAQGMLAAPSLLQSVFSDNEGLTDTWGPVVESVGQFAALVGNISKIHPYARLAWKVLSVIPKIINEQLKTDEELRNLVAAMKYTHDFVCNAKTLQEIEMHAEHFVKMSCATLECGYLIQEYVRTGSFAKRAAKNISGNAEKKLTAQIQSLRKLMDEFKDTVAIQTEISVMRTLEMAGSIQESVDLLRTDRYLDDMMYAKGAGCVPEKRCLEGTRRELLEEIIDGLHVGVDGEPSKRILFLTGVAGSGKSSVAHEIAHYFKSVPHRLGSSFCFNASEQNERSVDRFLSTISRNLAELDEGWRSALVDVIKSDRETRTTRSPRAQLEEFIIKPAGKLQFIGPIVVVVDALDEVARHEREALTDCLARLAVDDKLPDNLRFFITARPDPTLEGALQGPRVRHIDISSVDSKDDIRRFVEHEWTTARMNDEIFEEAWVPYLANQAQNSFQWAYTSCRFIRTDILGLSAQKRFSMLKDLTYRGLDPLYEAVLTQLVAAGTVAHTDPTEDQLRGQVLRVLGLIITAKEPLSWHTWMELVEDDSEDVEVIKSILPHFGSLFRGVSKADRASKRPIQPAHTSLIDYLTTPGKLFLVDTTAAHGKLLNMCLRTMETRLRFNICDLETSYGANNDVLDLAGRIEQNIPHALVYACRLWSAHLAAVPPIRYPFKAVYLFLERKLFLWLEVVSLLRVVPVASAGIGQVLKHTTAETLNPDTNKQLRKLDKMLYEVNQFISMCGDAITRSTPHLYLSTLAYIPEVSFIHRCYSGIYTGGVRTINKEALLWPESPLRITPRRLIYQIAVSPDGHLLATANRGKTVGLWNVVTGERVGKPLKGHTGTITSLAFSPDSKIIVSGSADTTIRLWDVTTGMQMGEALYGHESCIRLVAFFPDTETIISASDDITVRLWKVVNGKHVSEVLYNARKEAVDIPRDAHRRIVVAFSPSGKKFAFWADDLKIHIWSAETRQLVCALPSDGLREVTSLTFSPDGQILASISDYKPELWDVETGKWNDPYLLDQPVTCTVFSPDGQILALASLDGDIWLYMVGVGAMAGILRSGRMQDVELLAFSPDSQSLVAVVNNSTIHVSKTEVVMRRGVADHRRPIEVVAFSVGNDIAASGSVDGRIRLWDVRTGQLVGEPLEGHTHRVTSVVFSSDGKTIASCSDDHTICMWNVQTGQLIRQPLQIGQPKQLLALPAHEPRCLVFSPDGTIAAAVHYDALRLWSIATGEPLKPVFGLTGSVRYIAFSPNGRCLALQSDSGDIMLWDMTKGQHIGKPLLAHQSSTDSIVFSPDERFLERRTITGSIVFSPDGSIIASQERGTVQLWSTDTQEPFGALLKGLYANFTSLAFSPDGKTLVTGSKDGTIHLWDVATCKPSGRLLRGHTDTVSSIAFSPDGTMILSGSWDHTVRLWTAVNDTIPINSPVSDNVSSPHTSDRSQVVEYTDNSKIDRTGYVLGPRDELLFWVPTPYQKGLSRPSTRWVAGTPSLRLDLSRLAHGKQWAECRDASA